MKKRAAAGQRIDSARLSEAEALLVDRCCEQGGWNYGNANMLGKELRPYVPTTAVALLALQKTEQPAAVSSRRVWHISIARRPSEPSAVALSLSVMALRAHAHPADAVRALLATHSDRAIDLGHQLGVAMALYALQAEKADAFAL